MTSFNMWGHILSRNELNSGIENLYEVTSMFQPASSPGRQAQAPPDHPATRDAHPHLPQYLALFGVVGLRVSEPALQLPQYEILRFDREEVTDNDDSLH